MTVCQVLQLFALKMLNLERLSSQELKGMTRQTYFVLDVPQFVSWHMCQFDVHCMIYLSVLSVNMSLKKSIGSFSGPKIVWGPVFCLGVNKWGRPLSK